MSPAQDAPTKRSSSSAPRLSREATVALVLLPVLLVAGFLLGGRLLDDDPEPGAASDPVAVPTAAPDATAPGASEEPAAEPPATAVPEVPAAPLEEQPGTDGSAEPAPPAPAPAPQAPAPAPAPAPESAPVPPAAPDVLLAPGSVSADVQRWQARMVERGWDLEVDGVYGPQTRSVATRFQAEQGLAADGLVGPLTWAAAWAGGPA